jgi:ribosomal protein S27AE
LNTYKVRLTLTIKSYNETDVLEALREYLALGVIPEDVDIQKINQNAKCAKCGKEINIPVDSECPDWKLYCGACGYQEALKVVRNGT